MSQEIGPTRRAFLASLAAGVVVVPLLRLSPLQAADLPHLAPDDASAKPLHYVENAAEAKSDPQYQAGRHCGTCQLFQGGTAAFGPCAAFPGHAVSQNGWCRAWNAKA